MNRVGDAPFCRIRPASSHDLPAVEALLKGAALPLGGVEDHFAHFLIAESGGTVVGVVGLELHGATALLRSLAVAPEHRSRGTGGALCEAALNGARSSGANQVFLLTTSAAPFFERRGFHPVSRDSVSGPILNSLEFRGACPESATLMALKIL